MICPFPPGTFPSLQLGVFPLDLFDFGAAWKLTVLGIVFVGALLISQARPRRAAILALGLIVLSWLTFAGCGWRIGCHQTNTGCEQAQKKDKDPDGLSPFSTQRQR